MGRRCGYLLYKYSTHLSPLSTINWHAAKRGWLEKGEAWVQELDDIARAAVKGRGDRDKFAKVELAIEIGRLAGVLVPDAFWVARALLLARRAALRPLHDDCRILLRVAVPLESDVVQLEAADGVIGGRDDLGDRRRAVDLAHERVAVLVCRARLVKLTLLLALRPIETEPFRHPCAEICGAAKPGLHPEFNLLIDDWRTRTWLHLRALVKVELAVVARVARQKHVVHAWAFKSVRGAKDFWLWLHLRALVKVELAVVARVARQKYVVHTGAFENVRRAKDNFTLWRKECRAELEESCRQDDGAVHR